ncbi:cyclohexanecarboxylate-CoA ligase [Amycolatopsis acidiphila]|uniref:Cyclohexanecarboxylate-CoA ligase n=2 Tax=Amycolatopsis acidiphila TaxID=715473 RepID=A0A558AI32_9PSEU|nr:cyclohexanecarboxylate-CoA ligase [Amycolatopsis acidiphila]GHG86247.1 cyclohexanecarboxylate-CoA ligase [Amycolatopsis acidiphila]
MTTMSNVAAEYRQAGYRASGLWTEDRIGDLVRSRAARYPDRELFCFEGRRVTYREFDGWTTAVAADLVRRGVRPGDRVLVQLPNCLEALVLQVAAFRIGAIDVPVVPIYREHEMRRILADCRPAAVVAAAELSPRRPAEEFDGLLAEMGHQPAVRYIVGDHRDGWEQVTADAGDGFELPEPLPASAPALLLYTSGTTSAPKGALLTGQALYAHMRNFQEALGAGQQTVTLAATPLSHLGGFIAGVIFPAFLGGRSIIMRGWKPDEAVSLIEDERVSLMMGATVFVSDLVERYERGLAPRHRLPTYACAGAAIPGALVDRAAEVGVSVVRAYGMTETAGVCAIAAATDPLDRRRDWDGRVLRGMEIQAVDDNRRLLPLGSQGELRIRGPQLLTRYTDQGLTESQIDEDGWFYPGDVGRVDRWGWVQMTGRSKDIVNRGGEKFSTMDIELALASHPDIESAAVTAVPDARLGEGVGAWLVLAPGVTWQGPEKLIAHLEQEKLAKQKIPTQWHVIAAIPRTAAGKIQKHLLARVDDVVVQ